jgi:hypothetical protein
MASKNMRTNIFQEGNVGFKATIGLNKKHNYKEHEEKQQQETDANFCWMRSSLLASVDLIE